jgi:hypothetical protein
MRFRLVDLAPGRDRLGFKKLAEHSALRMWPGTTAMTPTTTFGTSVRSCSEPGPSRAGRVTRPADTGGARAVRRKRGVGRVGRRLSMGAGLHTSRVRRRVRHLARRLDLGPQFRLRHVRRGEQAGAEVEELGTDRRRDRGQAVQVRVVGRPPQGGRPTNPAGARATTTPASRSPGPATSRAPCAPRPTVRYASCRGRSTHSTCSPPPVHWPRPIGWPRLRAGCGSARSGTRGTAEPFILRAMTCHR